MNDFIRLVDVSQEKCIQNGLKYRQGLSSWRSDLDIFLVNEPDEQERKDTLRRIQQIPETLHPPKEIHSFHLERCLRILPNDQNTGGFFIAVIEKIESFPTDLQAPAKKKQKTKTAPVAPILSTSNDSLQVVSSSSHSKKQIKAMKEIGFNPKHASEKDQDILISIANFASNYQLFQEEINPKLFRKISSLFQWKSPDNYHLFLKNSKEGDEESSFFLLSDR
jgi:hypothetical protein